METNVTLQIQGKDVIVGKLFTTVRRGIESATFMYDADYLRSGDAIPLCPDMPLSPGAFHAEQNTMHRVFQDCMPDRWGRNLMLRAERQEARSEQRTARTLFEGDLLLSVNDETRQGALRFWNEDGTALAPSEHGVPREVTIPQLLTEADLAVQDMNADIRDLLAAGSSLGGARPKASVRTEQGDLCIAKFPKADESLLDDVCAWERTALQLAADAGITVPHTRLLRVRDRSVLIVERFDRKDGNRLPYISGLTAVQGRDGDHYSYLELVEFLEEYGAKPETDIRQLWLRALFSCAIGNTDNHMRNHGFLYTPQDRGWRLSPAFDINPTPGDSPKLLNSPIGFDDRSASIALAMEYADYFRLTAEQTRAMAASMADSLEHWQLVALSNGINAASIDMMRSCFESAVDRLRQAAA
ncbi:type II toxin-antitoxin system HipA family toxin [Bifidobacterium sp. SO4]|uniref:type II toxin-antitoxin system HipA family toxin n=1 Tax=Bifidobacterium sp. SO4 TaxID=2809030 RepID=UPI001BDCE34A|nr:type II toxin-antitoxin system HipA family toxin [Bifidobacterium sp. SO4]MBT1170694.1 type II toxin-antitoxin system HipA family toxin [Bifidobacterium sp. SO4]